MNNIIEGKQCTIVWHVDNLMISHADPDVVTDIINGLSTKYGGLKPLSKDPGKVYTYIGLCCISIVRL